MKYLNNLCKNCWKTLVFSLFVLTFFTNGDLIVSTSYELPKQSNPRIVPNFNYEIELNVGSESANMKNDEIGLKPMEQVDYSHPLADTSYTSVDDYDSVGMEHLYTITELFLRLIQSREIPPEFAESKSLDEVVDKVVEDKGKVLAEYYIGILVTAIFGLLLGVAILLVGLVICCCRCAGRCGGSKDEIEKPRDTCKQVVLGVIMFILVIIMLFGIVCAFTTNEYIKQNLKTMPPTLNSSVNDIQLYLRNTRTAVNTLLKTNYNELNRQLDKTLDRSGDIVKNRLGKTTEAFAINNLTDLVSGLEKVEVSLNKVSEKTKLIQSLAVELQLGLDTKRRSLLGLLSRCQIRTCDVIRSRYDMDLLRVKDDFSQLPNVSHAAREVSRLIKDDIVSEVKNGKQEFDDISYRIQKDVQTIIPDIKQRIRNVGNNLRYAANNVTDVIDKVNLDSAKQDISQLQQYLDRYSKYRWYISIGMGCIVLLVTLLLIFGLFCGICGKTSGNIYGDDNCSKNTGANFMLLAICVIIMVAPVVMIINTVLFLVGSLSDQIVCYPIQNMDNPQFMKVMDTYLMNEALPDVGKSYNLKPSQALIECHRNKSLYHVFNLQTLGNVTDIKSYRKEYKIDVKLNEFLKQIKVNPKVTILSDVAKRQLRQLADSHLSDINFTAYSAKFQDQITALDIPKFSEDLANLADSIIGSRLSSQLKLIAVELRAYHPEYVEKIKKNLQLLKVDVENLQRDIKFNQSSFRAAVHYLIDTAEKAQDYIQNNGRKEIEQLANAFIDEFTGTIDGYAKHLQYQVDEVIGKCGPVSKAINATITATCKKILLPFNGFWTSIGWCLLLWLPAMLVAFMLSVLYRRVDPYAGSLVESETFDSYLDRDNIPLANVDKKKRRKRRRPDSQSYENRNGYVPDYSPMSDYPNASGGNNRSRNHARHRSNGYIPAPTSSEDTTPNAPGEYTIGIISSPDGASPPGYFEKPPPYFYPGRE